MTAHEQAEQKLNEAILHCQQIDKAVGLLKQAVDKVRHHKRVTAALKNEFERLGSGYLISMTYDKAMFGQFSIGIWGNGLEYNRRLYVCLSSSRVTESGWAAIDEELTHYDRAKQIEAYRAELTKLAKLDEFAETIGKLHKEAQAYAVAGIDEDIRRYGSSSILEEAYPFLKRH